jgi:hypothetical protein
MCHTYRPRLRAGVFASGTFSKDGFMKANLARLVLGIVVLGAAAALSATTVNLGDFPHRTPVDHWRCRGDSNVASELWVFSR